MGKVIIDSRLVVPGSIFIAIKGEHVDGHDFIGQAVEKGASLIIAERSSEASGTTPVEIVPDSLRAFQDLARQHLARLTLKKIAITGSSGKTTTKSIIASALESLVGQKKVLASVGTQNNHFGVPITALKVTAAHDFGVFELGMNHAGEIAVLADIVQPDIAVITNIGSTHSSNFADADGIMNAKAEIYASLSAGGVAIVNGDSEKCRRAVEKFSGQKFYFGAGENCDVRLIKVSTDLVGTNFELLYQGEKLAGHVDLLGVHNAMNSAAAVAVLVALKFPFPAAVAAVGQAKASYRRLEKHVLPNQAVVIDDCYNASPESVKASLEALRQSAGQRKIVVLGDMLELSFPVENHREIGRLLAELKPDALYFCGEFAKYYALGAIDVGFPGNKIICAPDSAALALLISLPESGDILLVKGSRGMRMEKVVEHLLS